MKQFLFILVFSFISFSSNSQEVSIMNNDNGQPAVISLRLPDTTYIHHIKDGQIPEHLILGDKYMLSPKELFEHGDDGNHSNYIGNMDSIEPGVLPEADLPYKLKYSPDGTKLIAMYHHTNNLYVYSIETWETLATINIGDGPIDMEVNEQHIYVCCYYSDDIYIINLDDYSIEDSFPVEHQPCVIEVNADESIIYVGFDNGEHLDAGGFLAAYGLSAFNQLFLTYWPYIGEMWRNDGRVGRQIYSYSDFLLIGNDNYIASLQTAGHQPIILNAITGEIEKSFDIYYTSSLAVTASKDSLYIFAHRNDSLYFYCIDSYTHDVVDSMFFPQTGFFLWWTWQDNMAVNADGSKLVMEMGSLMSDTYAFLVDFGSHDYKVITLGEYAEVLLNTLISHDGRYVIMTGESIRVFDFETEDYTFSQYQSVWALNKVIAISPISYNFVMSDNNHNYYHTHTKRDEYIEICNFSDPANVIKTDSIFCGETPEADLIFSAVLNNTHEKIITGNPLSGNISIIDASTYLVDTILDIEHISSVVNVGDDLIALSGYHSPYLILFDLSTLSIVKEFHLDYYYILIPSPDKQYLYAYSRWEDKLIKISIDGNNSFIVGSLDISDFSAVYITVDYTYSPEISPDGKYILFHGQGTMKIVDTETMSQVSEVSVSGAGIHDMAFTDDSKRVCIAYWYLDTYFDILYLDGENSYLENTVYTPAGEGGMSVAFNSIDNKFYLAKKLDIWVVDPETAIVEDTINFNVKDSQIQIGISPQGEPFVNTIKYLYFDDQEIYLKEPTRKFYVDYASQKCIIPSPGPDRVYILDFLTTEIHEIPVSKVDPDVHIYPNPTSDIITIKSGKLIKRIEIFNSSGEKLFDKNFRNAITTLNMAPYPEGIYIVKIHREEDISVKKVLVVH